MPARNCIITLIVCLEVAGESALPEGLLWEMAAAAAQLLRDDSVGMQSVITDCTMGQRLQAPNGRLVCAVNCQQGTLHVGGVGNNSPALLTGKVALAQVSVSCHMRLLGD